MFAKKQQEEEEKKVGEEQKEDDGKRININEIEDEDVGDIDDIWGLQKYSEFIYKLSIICNKY